MTPAMTQYEHILGCLTGTAVGDAIGLPREGLSSRRAVRLFGLPPCNHALIAGRGLCSDDTEHTVMVAMAWLAAAGDVGRFRRELARRLRWWLVRLPAGIGRATLRACIKLWLGVSAERSGVRSAGNGPAMRSAILGLIAESDEQLRALVAASTQITHTDSRAEEGALVIAATARLIRAAGDQRVTRDDVLDGLIATVRDEQLRDKLLVAIEQADGEADLRTAAEALGCPQGVSGFVNDTVPAAVYCWFANQRDYRGAVESALLLGGDADTVAAIAGALAGTQTGRDGIPQPWLDGLTEWPCTPAWLDRLAKQLASPDPQPVRLSPWLLLLRNLVFIPVVLMHGFRRLLPPY